MIKPTSEELALLHTELCSALSDVTRIAILYELADGPLHVSAIVEALEQPQGTVSRHLRVLRERGLVKATRDANRVHYAVAQPRILDVLNLMRDILADVLRHQGEVAARIRGGRAQRPRRKTR